MSRRCRCALVAGLILSTPRAATADAVNVKISGDIQVQFLYSKAFYGFFALSGDRIW
jgi:hypothetical protein